MDSLQKAAIKGAENISSVQQKSVESFKTLSNKIADFKFPSVSELKAAIKESESISSAQQKSVEAFKTLSNKIADYKFPSVGELKNQLFKSENGPRNYYDRTSNKINMDSISEIKSVDKVSLEKITDNFCKIANKETKDKVNESLKNRAVLSAAIQFTENLNNRIPEGHEQKGEIKEILGKLKSQIPEEARFQFINPENVKTQLKELNTLVGKLQIEP